MSYVHCVWMPLKIQFRDSVKCRESPVGLRLALIRGLRGSASCTVLMLFTDLVVRLLPDFSVFQFWLVPCVEYFAKFLKIVPVHGGCGSRNLSSNAQLPALDFQSNIIVL